MIFPEMKHKKPAWHSWLRRGVLILLLAASAVLWQYHQTGKEADVPPPTPAPTMEPDRRSVREAAYDKDVQALTALLQSGAADADTQAQAAKHLDELIMAHQAETAVEEALLEAGYDRCAVVISGGAVTVMLPAEAINAQNSAAVVSLCAAHANVGADSIRLMPME